MSRLISVAHTVESVVDRRKTQTRRLGWWKDRNGRRLLQVGDWLTLCAKVQGRRHVCRGCNGEPRPCALCGGTGWQVDPLERLAVVRVADVRREPLWDITPDDVRREAVSWEDPSGVARFDEWSEPFVPTPEAWVRWFCAAMGCRPDTVVTVITWQYRDHLAGVV